MEKIRKGDIVIINKGKDRGKKGKVVMIFTAKKAALVEGLNLFKKHKRRTQQDPQGGFVSVEMPVRLCNLAVVCKRCNRGVKVGFKAESTKSKVRVCRVCKEVL